MHHLADITSVRTLDLHAAGEPCRVLYQSLYDLPGDTMRERVDYMKEHLDAIRSFLMQEPRGHKAMFGSILTRPATPDADVGILYTDSDGYLDMCIHGTICTSRAVAELGLPLHTPGHIVFDAVCGRIESDLHYGPNGKVDEVTVQNVPSFVFTPEPIQLEVPGFGTLPAHVVFAGNFFVLVEYPANEPISAASHDRNYFIDLGMRICNAANAAIAVSHPTNPSTKRIALAALYQRVGREPLHVRNTVIFDGQMDRSPCGSGTSALMTLMHHLGELDYEQPYISESYLGSRFYGCLRPAAPVGFYPAVTPRVTGKPYLTARCEFFRESEDPFRDGFLLA